MAGDGTHREHSESAEGRLSDRIDRLGERFDERLDRVRSDMSGVRDTANEAARVAAKSHTTLVGDGNGTTGIVPRLVHIESQGGSLRRQNTWALRMLAAAVLLLALDVVGVSGPDALRVVAALSGVPIAGAIEMDTDEQAGENAGETE